MGLNLRREAFGRWLQEYVPYEHQADFLERLGRHVGRKIDVEAWQVEDDAYPKVGSYTSYGVFFDCLVFVTQGDYQDQLDQEDDIEWDALKEFRQELSPASLKIPYASHLLEAEVSDSIFIPLMFETPFVHCDQVVSSLPGARAALEAFATGLGFDLTEEEPELCEDGRWLPVATARNISRILYAFFTEKQDACVAYV
jgi:hypothetical protein